MSRLVLPPLMWCRTSTDSNISSSSRTAALLVHRQLSAYHLRPSIPCISSVGIYLSSKGWRSRQGSLDLELTKLSTPSFYPLFPVPANDSASVNLDVSHGNLLRFNTSPNILILPSKLKTFNKVSSIFLFDTSICCIADRHSQIVGSTVVVNPSFVARGGATFARIVVPATSLNPQLVKVDIIKVGGN